MLRLAVRHGRIAAVPYIEMLAEPPPRQGFFEDGPYQAVQRRLAEDLQVVVAIAKTYGWRADSEILPLRRREHLDLTAGTLRLDPGMAKNDEGRLVVLIPEIYAALAGQVERVEALSRRLGRVIPWLFPHLTGRWAGAQRKGFRKAWATACRTAGVPGRLVHDLRRTAVRDMDRSEVGRSVAMKMTGHKTESVYRRYAIVSETDLREAAAKLAASTTTSTTGGFSRTPRSANSRNS
jgi:integrase